MIISSICSNGKWFDNNKSTKTNKRRQIEVYVNVMSIQCGHLVCNLLCH